MGTVFSLDVRAPGVDPAAVDEAIRWLHWVDATFSTYRADSDISRIARGELDQADAAPEVGTILRRCDELEGRTQGYFSAYAGESLDPSGLVKGWAIERAGAMARRPRRGQPASLNGGGDVQCAGSAGPDQPWRIGIVDPADRSACSRSSRAATSQSRRPARPSGART